MPQLISFAITFQIITQKRFDGIAHRPLAGGSKWHIANNNHFMAIISQKQCILIVSYIALWAVLKYLGSMKRTHFIQDIAIWFLFNVHLIQQAV